MNAHETRHQKWVEVGPSNIRAGDRYRIEYENGGVWEGFAERDRHPNDFLKSATYFIWPRPEKKPWEAIPEGRKNAAVMAVSADGGEPVVGTYYRDAGEVVRVDPYCLGGFRVSDIRLVTSAVPVTAVPSEALDELRSGYRKWNTGAGASDLYAAVYKLLEGAES